MYAAIWRILPGPVWLKVIFAIILIAAVLYALCFYVFPWASQFFTPEQESTVQ